MLKSNRSFMSISKRGSELCSQLVLVTISLESLLTTDSALGQNQITSLTFGN